jgi:uncharacterized protein (UPF0332 family)
LDNATRALIGSYLAKARDKSRVARELRDRGDWDDAVSRAYYAAFHAAQAALLTKGQRADTHPRVVVLFGLLLVKTGKLDRRWGKFLANLKDDREAGDYDPLSYVEEDTAARAVQEADELVAAVARYINTLDG